MRELRKKPKVNKLQRISFIIQMFRRRRRRRCCGRRSVVFHLHAAAPREQSAQLALGQTACNGHAKGEVRVPAIRIEKCLKTIFARRQRRMQLRNGKETRIEADKIKLMRFDVDYL